MQARSSQWDRAFDLPHLSGCSLHSWEMARENSAIVLRLLERLFAAMKLDRHNAIRELVGASPIQSQDELRRKLRRRGFAVTQATLSRDLHEMHLFKGADGYGLSNGNGYSACLLYTSDAADDLLCVDLGGRRIIKKK